MSSGPYQHQPIPGGEGTTVIPAVHQSLNPGVA
jgi:hypothetical protein